MLLKKIATYTLAAVMATSVIMPSADAFAAVKTGNAKSKNAVTSQTKKSTSPKLKKAKLKELLKGVKITKVKWNDDPWAKALEFEEFDKYNGGIAEYIRNIKDIKVNNRSKYVSMENASPDAQEFAYDFSAQGLRLKKGVNQDRKSVV